MYPPHSASFLSCCQWKVWKNQQSFLALSNFLFFSSRLYQNLGAKRNRACTALLPPKISKDTADVVSGNLPAVQRFMKEHLLALFGWQRKRDACQGRVALESGRVGMFCANQQTGFNIFAKNSQGATKSVSSADLYISGILSTKVQNLRCQP